MKKFSRKNKGFVSCIPDMLLGVIFLAVAGVVVYYAYTEEQQKQLEQKNITKVIERNKIENKK